ncbi:MAG: hypothetical protein AAB870_02350, partial [Patescibacteria group bacterium]
MILQSISSIKRKGIQLINIVFLFQNKQEIVWFEILDNQFVYDERRADFFLTFAVLPAMIRGEDIDLSGFSVSPLLLASIDRIQDIYLEWFKELALTKINIVNLQEEILETRICDRIVASFFSGGIDSFDTVINSDQEDREEKIGFLLYIYGYDIRLGDEILYAATRNHLDAAAKDLGKKMVYIGTNL